MTTRDILSTAGDRIVSSDRKQTVKLYQYLPTTDANHPYNAAAPYTVANAYQKPLTRSEEQTLTDAKVSPERTGWRFFVKDMTASWYSGAFDPSSVRVKPKWLLVETDGTQWVLSTANLHLIETHWRCAAVMYTGELINA